MTGIVVGGKSQAGNLGAAKLKEDAFL